MLHDPPDLAGELVDVEHRLPLGGLLGLDEGVEASLGVVLDVAHGTGCVQDDADVRVVFHGSTSCLVIWRMLSPAYVKRASEPSGPLPQELQLFPPIVLL